MHYDFVSNMYKETSNTRRHFTWYSGYEWIWHWEKKTIKKIFPFTGKNFSQDV